ncbi:MAG: hypothetical protein ACK5JT_11605, partial [Hyphomicrobiaceae bacterium]
MGPDKAMKKVKREDGDLVLARVNQKRIGRFAAGAAIAVLLAGTAAAAVQARTGSELFSPEAAAGARAPVTAAAVPGFSDLVKAVKPAVVSVRVKSRESNEQLASMNGENPFAGTPFEKFFKDFRGFDENGHGIQRHHKAPLMQALGSGF